MVWIGLVVTGLGIVCGLIAYGSTIKEYDPPIVSWWPGVKHRFRLLSRRIATRLAGPFPQEIRPDSIPSQATVGTPTFVVDPIVIPDDAPVDERIRLLVRRLEHAESMAETDRHRFDEELRRLRADLSGQVEHLRAADEQITAEARGMSVGTARLQMFGLMLMGVGTVVLTVPSLFPS